MSELPSGTVTFLFTDIEGSTRLLRQLGDRYGEVLAEHRRILRGAFAGQGGREIDTQGDAFFVAFGRAREAALAAAAGQRALAAHPWPDGVEPRVRMGLHTGEPTVGEEGYHGFGVHRAARIMAAGHGGQVLCSQATWAVLEDERLPGIAIRELGAYRLKDIDRPERLFQLEIEGLPQEFPPLRAPEQAAPERPLLPAGELPLPGPLVRGSPFPFVGREAELAMLRGLLGRAESGEGGLVLLSAEGGGGKTRLVRELAREAVGRGLVVLYGTSDAAVTTPYQPVREWLEFLLRVCDPEALRECLGGRGGELARVVPELEGLTGRPADTGEVDRHSLQGAVVEFLSRFSRRRPLLVVADDVHWADGETLHLLRRLAGAVPEARVLVIAAHRDRGEEMSPELAGTLADLSRVDGVSRLALGGLGADEVGAFVRDAADADAAPELVAAIGELTDGSPLLLCELWRDLRESGAVETVNTVRLTRPVAELRGSGRLGEVVQQRLSRLAPETSAFVELAAVAGARFELGVVGEAAGLDRAALVAAVEEATESGIVEELPDPTPACRFSHELVRRAVYDRIKRLRRSELHLRVGEALERANASDPSHVLPELAHHFTIAAPLVGGERAVDYNLRASEAAVAAGAYDVAAARLAAALELGIAEPLEHTRVQIELAYLLIEIGRVPEAEALLAASLDAATGLEERGLAARALLRASYQQIWRPAVNPERVRPIAQDALGTYTALGDPRGVAEAEHLVALVDLRVGRFAHSRAALERALVHARACDHRPTLRHATGSLAFIVYEGPVPVDEAIRRCEELRQASRDDRALEAGVARILAALFAMAGRRDDAIEYARRSSLVLDELDIMTASWAHRQVTAHVKALLGDRAGAARELEAVWLRLRDRREDEPDARAMQRAYELALLYCDEGRWDDAEDCLAYGHEVPVSPWFSLESVYGLAGRARLAAHRGEGAEALALARRAVELADRSDRPNLRARIRLARAEVQRADGRAQEADASCAAALALYEQKGNVVAAARLRVPSPGST